MFALIGTSDAQLPMYTGETRGRENRAKYSAGPLSSILSTQYSYRTVTLIGGTFAASGMMLSYFANSVTYLYIRYAVTTDASVKR